MYNEAFGEQPEDIWEYEDMFAPLGLPKQTFNTKSFIIVGILVFILAIYPCYNLLRPLYIHINNPGFLTGYVLLFCITLFILEVNNRLYLLRIASKWPGFTFIYNLTPLELVYLKTGKIADVVHGLVNEFIRTDKILLNSDKTLRLVYYGKDDNVENYTVLNALQGLEPAAYPVFVGQVVQKPIFVNIIRSITGFRKYFTKSKAYSKMFYSNFIITALILMLGFVRLLTGVLRDKPVQFILIIMILLTLFAAAFLWRVTTLICSNTIPRLYKTSIIPTIGNTDSWDWQYFIAGTSVFSPAFMPLVQRADNSGNASGGCGSGGSCGGGCGGGGCGGCGGGD